MMVRPLTVTGTIDRRFTDYELREFQKAFRRIFPKWILYCKGLMENARTDAARKINKIAAENTYKSVNYVYKKVVPPNFIINDSSITKRNIDLKWVIDDVVDARYASKPYTENKYLEAMKVLWIDGGVPSAMHYETAAKFKKRPFLSFLQDMEWRSWEDKYCRGWTMPKQDKTPSDEIKSYDKSTGNVPEKMYRGRLYTKGIPGREKGQKKWEIETPPHIGGRKKYEQVPTSWSAVSMTTPYRELSWKEAAILAVRQSSMIDHATVAAGWRKSDNPTFKVQTPYEGDPYGKGKALGYPAFAIHETGEPVTRVVWEPRNVIGPTFAHYLIGPGEPFPITSDIMPLHSWSPALRYGLDMFFDEVEGKRRTQGDLRLAGAMRVTGRGSYIAAPTERLPFRRVEDPYARRAETEFQSVYTEREAMKERGLITKKRQPGD